MSTLDADASGAGSLELCKILYKIVYTKNHDYAAADEFQEIFTGYLRIDQLVVFFVHDPFVSLTLSGG